jgi:GNAT superfamily N-acetyltransferase
MDDFRKARIQDRLLDSAGDNLVGRTRASTMSQTEVEYRVDDREMTAEQFLELAQRVWPGDYDPDRVREALARTLNFTGWIGSRLVGSVRILSDGYFFGTVTELLVDSAYQGQGIGRRLMELAWDASPTSLFFGAQPGKEQFYESLGYERSLASFARRKPRTGRPTSG